MSTMTMSHMRSLRDIQEMMPITPPVRLKPFPLSPKATTTVDASFPPKWFDRLELGRKNRVEKAPKVSKKSAVLSPLSDFVINEFLEQEKKLHDTPVNFLQGVYHLFFKHCCESGLININIKHNATNRAKIEGGKMYIEITPDQLARSYCGSDQLKRVVRGIDFSCFHSISSCEKKKPGALK